MGNICRVMGNIEAASPTATSSVLSSVTGSTIAVPAEMPQSIVLANSFLKFHPQNEFAILLLDRPGNAPSLPRGTRLLYPADLGLEMGEEWRLPMLYSAHELASILMPVLLQSLLNSGAAVAAYFEVATEIFNSLSDILGLIHAEQAIIVTEAVRSDLGGNLGPSFAAAGRGAEQTLRSWFNRLQNPNSNSETIRPIDSGPAWRNPVDSVSHRVITKPGFAVGYWNLNQETFAWTGEHYEVDGKPLRSFDFRGYDPGKPHLLSKHQGTEPRVLLSEWPVIAKLCDEYQDKLMKAGYDQRQRRSYPFDYLSNGLRIDHRMLGLYRQAHKMSKQGLEKEPPTPFGPGGDEGFLSWLNEPLEKTTPPVTRYMLAVYDEREDVRKAFPDPLGADARGFRDWYLLFGQRELDLPAVFLPPDVRAKSESGGGLSDSIRASSVNVAGYFRAELGIGAAARSLVTALEASRIPFNTISFEGTANRQSHSFLDRQAEGIPADINIVCVNADRISAFAETTGPELWEGRYTIGVWFWEVEDFPPLFHGAFNYVDELWVASNFMRETFLKVSPKPVFKFKLPVLIPEIDLSLSRADLGLPNQFIFLFSFDFFSVLERKNPLGLIKAFTQAFRPAEGPMLVIKTINGDKRILEMEKLRYAARGRSDIILADGYLSAIEQSTITALADCYVSLHRSEGFGLTIAEAMALGKPAIATAYSGNLEFMTEANSFLCPYQRSEVGLECEPYPASSHWAEPDLESAAQLLRYVYTHQEEASRKGLKAAEDIRTLHSAAGAGSVIRDRLAKVRARRAASRPLRSVGFLEDRIEELEGLPPV